MAVLLSGLLLSACGGGSSTTVVVAVTLTPATASVATGATLQFSATVTGSSNTGVIWQVNGANGGNATTGTISTAGLYTAPSTVPSPSTVTVTAVSQADSTKSASATVTITVGGIAVTVSPTATTLAPGATQQFSASVSGSSNTGVTWQVNGITGGNSAIGTVSSSGLYTAPAAIPSPSTVTVTAVAQADSTKSASASVTISTSGQAFSDASLNGTYAFEFDGFDLTVGTSISSVIGAGVFTADGNGNITSGQEDLNDGTQTQAQQFTLTGSYTVNSNGTGTMTLHSGGTPLTLSLVLLSDGSARFILVQTALVGSGQMARQDPGALSTASLAGTYAFQLQGDNQVSNTVGHLVTTGVLTFNANGQIASGTQDLNNQGSITQNVSLTGSYTLDGATGRAAVSLTSHSGTLNFAVYIASAQTQYWVETDFPFPALGGEALRQSGGPFSVASISGDFVYNSLGVTLTSNDARAGKFRLNGNGAVSSGVFDENNAGAIGTNNSINGGTYTVTSDGRLMLTLTSTGTQQTYAGVLVSANQAFLMGTESSSASSGAFFSQRTPQSGGAFSNADLTGTVGGFLTGISASGPQDLIPQLTADGSGNMTGTMDSNDNGSVLNAQTTTATYSISQNGRGTMAVTGAGKTRNFAFYLATGGGIVMVNQDASELLTGQLLP